ncbi:MAG: T9SS type A sorting domain-containing protein [Ignavibacteria bacterium]|nr:T9SS type A sorting domain-containing protein [Ignavibacteria bacterium]
MKIFYKLFFIAAFFLVSNISLPQSKYANQNSGKDSPLFTHDYGVVNFLSFPSVFFINSTYNIKAKVYNFGTSAETNVPVSLFVNGTQVGSAVNLSLAPGGSDSVSYLWTPTTTGSKFITVVSQLSTDQLRSNDTLRATVYVVTGATVTLFSDQFTTLENWTLASAGTVPWALQTSAYNSMVMPSTAVLPYMSCNVDATGNGNSSNAVATLTTGINCTNVTDIVLTFDQDWYALSSNDQAIIDYSINGGANWVNLATWNTSHRDETAALPIPGATNAANLKIRFTCIQPSWDWWWAIDNVTITGYYSVLGISDPKNTNSDYKLTQNYPNPFNPTTQIKYSIKTNGLVTLKVYDLLGKEVTTLVNEVKTAGSHTVDFNGANLPSGTYIYRMESNGFTDVKKMILVK